MRNVFLSRGQIVLYQYYQKKIRKEDTKIPVIRFLPKSLSLDFARFLIYIHPVTW